MKFIFSIHILILLFLRFQLESCANEPVLPQGTAPAVQTPVDGIRIAWDYSSMVKIAPANDQPPGYYGYARLIQLHDKRLACVYETSAGNIELAFSLDLGKSWERPQVVFETKKNIAMAVPEIIELKDHSILVGCNPRPRKPYNDDRKFGIKVRKSNDGGKNWLSEQVIYEALSTFENGCWEPSFAQLPSGEVQLFYANEGVYTTSNEQNISMFKSVDSGKTWTTTPTIIGFRAGRRDGMPVPLLLPEKNELLVAVEDNKVGEFKPTIYREKLTDNWADGFISANDSRRLYQPLKDQLADNIYAGAPYLARLQSGEVLLSYQSNIDRTNLWNQSAMVVEIGDDAGTLFSRRSIPFVIPSTKSGLWNSLAVIQENIPVAITSTNGFSSNSTEVWMIKGHVIPEFVVLQGTPTVDGQITDACWQQEWPYFVGHKSNVQMKAMLCLDETNLFLAAQIDEADLASDASNEVVFQLDTERKGYEKPHTGIFAFHCNFNGNLAVEEGNSGNWENQKEIGSLQYKITKQGNLYLMELSIPLKYFKMDFKNENTMGINFILKYKLKSGYTVEESVSPNDNNRPYTWSPIRMN